MLQDVFSGALHAWRRGGPRPPSPPPLGIPKFLLGGTLSFSPKYKKLGPFSSWIFGGRPPRQSFPFLVASGVSTANSRTRPARHFFYFWLRAVLSTANPPTRPARHFFSFGRKRCFPLRTRPRCRHANLFDFGLQATRPGLCLPVATGSAAGRGRQTQTLGSQFYDHGRRYRRPWS